MVANINLIEVAATLADRKVKKLPFEIYDEEGEKYTDKAQDYFNEFYEDYFDLLLKCQTTIKPKPIKLQSAREVLKKVRIDFMEFRNKVIYIPAAVKNNKTLTGLSIFNFEHIVDEHGNNIDFAINSFHPQFIRLIFASLQRLDLVDQVLYQIENYGKGDKV